MEAGSPSDQVVFGREVITLEAVQVLGTHPQPFRYYLRLAAGTFRTMLDVGMLALGTGLVGLAAAIALDAFDLASIGIRLSTTALLGASLVVGVIGAFALGIASEGGYGAPESVRGYPMLETAIGRAFGALVVGVLLLVASSRLEEFVSDLSLPLRAAHLMLDAVGRAGTFVVPLVGVPVSFLIRRSLDSTAWGEELELPLLYLVWTVATLLLYSMPVA
jgi:hypothetical protein